METAERLASSLNHLRAELSRAENQLDCLDDIAVVIDDTELEQQLRNIATNIRGSIGRVRGDLRILEGGDRDDS